VPDPVLATIPEAAAALRVSPSTVRRMLASGDLPRIPIRRAVRTTWEAVRARAHAKDGTP